MATANIWLCLGLFCCFLTIEWGFGTTAKSNTSNYTTSQPLGTTAKSSTSYYTTSQPHVPCFSSVLRLDLKSVIRVFWCNRWCKCQTWTCKRFQKRWPVNRVAFLSAGLWRSFGDLMSLFRAVVMNVAGRWRVAHALTEKKSFIWGLQSPCAQSSNWFSKLKKKFFECRDLNEMS